MSRFATKRPWSTTVLTAAIALAMTGGPALADAPAPAAMTAGLFDLYQDNRTHGIPNLITPDLLLVSYSLIREQSASRTEKQQLVPLFQQMLTGVGAGLEARQEADPLLPKARAYIRLISALLEGKEPAALDIPGMAEEWKLLREADTLTTSPLFGVPVDYSQLQPRGRYTRTPEMQQYFRAVRYAGTVHFFSQSSPATGISPEKAAELTQLARLLTREIQATPTTRAAYEGFLQRLAWEYGKPVDLSARDYGTLDALDWKDPTKLAAGILQYARDSHKSPAVFDTPVDVSKLQPGETLPGVVTGWRLVPSMLNNDAAVMQQMTWPASGEFVSPCGEIRCLQPWSVGLVDGKEVKAYLRGIELLALLDVPHAATVVDLQGENRFSQYAAVRAQGRQLLQAQNGLNGLQFDFIRKASAGYARPESFLAFWTWQRYINLLYVKQSMTMGSKSVPAAEKARPGARLEGGAAFYRSMSDLVAQHQKQTPDPVWDKFQAVLKPLVTMAATKPAANPAHDAVLNNLDKELLALTGGKDRPVVVDVHTNPIEKMVQEEATGMAMETFRDKARGGVLSHYEFKQPMNQRLTVEAWQKAILK